MSWNCMNLLDCRNYLRIIIHCTPRRRYEAPDRQLRNSECYNFRFGICNSRKSWSCIRAWCSSLSFDRTNVSIQCCREESLARSATPLTWKVECHQNLKYEFQSFAFGNDHKSLLISLTCNNWLEVHLYSEYSRVGHKSKVSKFEFNQFGSRNNLCYYSDEANSADWAT